MEKTYLTIAEAAEIAGVTPQAIYKRLKTTLKPYLLTVEGKKVLEKEAIELLLKKEVDEPLNPTSTLFNNGLNSDKTSGLFEETLKTLQDQLKIKDEQLKAKDFQLQELNDRLKEANELNKHNQMLLMQTMKQIPAPTEEETVEVEYEQEKEPDEEVRLPWYKRIFK